MPHNHPPVLNIQNPPAPAMEPLTPSHKRPSCTPGLLGTSAAYFVPDHICKKFMDGWNVHIPLTDRGCLLKDKSAASSAQDMLTLNNSCILTTLKPLSDEGGLDLTFDIWHQAWR